jgi:sodium/hydrogen antiporter
MYQDVAMLAVFLLICSAVAGRIERSSDGVHRSRLYPRPRLFDVWHINISGEGFRLLAELAIVLLTDAANANLDVLKRNIGVPIRLLLVGLSLAIVWLASLCSHHSPRWR